MTGGRSVSRSQKLGCIDGQMALGFRYQAIAADGYDDAAAAAAGRGLDQERLTGSARGIQLDEQKTLDNGYGLLRPCFLQTLNSERNRSTR